MSLNIFDTEFLLDLVVQAKPAKSFLLNAFFKQEKQYKTKKVRLDLWDGQRRKAAYINRREQSQFVEKIGYISEDYEPPVIGLKDRTDVDDLLNRQPGEVVMRNPQSPREEAVFALAQQFAEFDTMITRTEELQAKEALFDGTLTFNDISGNQVADQIDFQRNSDLAMAIADLIGGDWANTTNAKPVDDLDEIRRRIQRISGMKSDYAVMGELAWRRFKETDQVINQLDNRRIMDNDKIVREMEASGAIFRGEIENFKIFTYDEWYIDEDSTGTDELSLVPVNQVLVGSTEAKATRCYGAVPKIEQNSSGSIQKLFAEKRVPDSWVDKDPDARFVRLQSAPAMLTHQPNAYGVLTPTNS